MVAFWIIIGSILPALCGHSVLLLLERNYLVLQRCERCVIGFVLGNTLVMYLVFLVHTIGIIKLNVVGYVSVQVVVLVVLLVLRKRLVVAKNEIPRSPVVKLSGWGRIVVVVLSVWIVIKIFACGFTAITSPIYSDDSFNNWNLRGKVFLTQERLQLEVYKSDKEVNRFSAYPPTIPMTKTWLASLSGEWDEGLVNSVHLVWYVCGLILIFFVLRRMTSFWWAAAGVYVLSSLPLYTVHSAVPYGDLHLSNHLLIAISALAFAVQSSDENQRCSWHRIGAISVALLLFTKNEALLIYLPVVALLLAVAWCLKRSNVRDIIWYASLFLAVLVPWVVFKTMNGLVFANAASVGSYRFGWQPGALKALWISLFFEGNWILLLPVLIVLLAASYKKLLRSDIIIYSLFFILAFAIQMGLYLFTDLSELAINQTGTARGVLQIIPIAVVLLISLTRCKCRDPLGKWGQN